MKKTFAAFILCIVLCAAAPGILPRPALAATISVTNTGDSPTAGSGSLRAAINFANAQAVGTSTTISFNIPGAGPHTIAPASALPTITAPVTIDGYTQPGASVNTLVAGDNAVLRIELNGASAGAGVNGLSLTAGASGSAVRGLVINRFTRDGISLNDTDNTTISGNFIGTDPTGLIDRGNGSIGVEEEFFTNANNNLIGGTTPAARNVISGNGGSGVEFGAAATGNTVQGNFIGLGADGTTALGNGGSGVYFGAFTSGTLIGGDDAADGTTDGVVHARNYIAGNGGGIFLGGSGFGGATVQGNYIGTDATGTLARPNLNGIDTNIAHNAVVGGATAGAGNLISGNTNQGIALSFTTGFIVKGNRIGTQADGLSALGNGANGIFFNAGPANTQIGGTAAGEGNVIAFNGGDGVQMDSGAGNLIRANSIHSNGTTANHLGIDLGTDGVAANDAGDPDTGANNLQNYPVISSVTVSGGNTTIAGTLNSTSNATFALDFFRSAGADPSGFGEGQTYIGSTTVTTTPNPKTFSVTLPVAVPLGQFVTATATNNATGDTSEFSQAVLLPAPCTPAPSGLVSWWPAEGDARDIISGNNGTLQGGATFPAGKVGQAFNFNGTSYVQVPDAASLKPAQITLEAWVKPVAFGPPEWDSVISKGSASGSVNSYFLGLHNGQPSFVTFHANGQNLLLDASTQLTLNQWHHLAATFDGTTKNLYVDGVLANNSQIISPLSYENGVPLLIGEDIDLNAPAGFGFNGQIDEPSVYNRALSAAEIQAIFNAGSTGKCTESSAGDFSATSNPASPWSYGVLSPGAAPNPATFSMYGQHIVNGGLDFWTITGNPDPSLVPAVIYNATGATIGLQQAGQLALHPGSTGQYSVVRWTAPAAGSYAVAANFTGIDAAPTTTDVHVLHNSSALFDGTVNDFQVSHPFNTTVTVAAGDTIDFVVGYGANNNYTSDTTALSANITALVPETPSPIVTTTADTVNSIDNLTSLREAINFANSNPGTTISFNISGAGPHTIAPTAPMPAITANGTIVDASTQAGFSGTPLIVLSGQNSGVRPPASFAAALTITADNCVVRSVAFNNGFPVGIRIVGTGAHLLASNNRVEGCHFGTNAAGTAASPIDIGISITNDGFTPGSGATNNIIGGTSAAARNIISSNLPNSGFGIDIQGANTSGNRIIGNYIGPNVAGTGAIGSTFGIGLSGGAHDNLIGGTTPGERNIISGNGTGILIYSNDNQVLGNFIGTNVGGNAALPNASAGVSLDAGATGNVIGGVTATPGTGAGNVISGNGGAGVEIQGRTFGTGAFSNHNLVQGNVIGLRADRTGALANQRGVLVWRGALDNTIGGTVSGTRNVISGNAGDGVTIADSGTARNLVQGNYIGTNAAGSAALGNSTGVTIYLGARNNTVGGTVAAARNVISGNMVDGVHLAGAGTTGNSVRGNFIGTDAGGTANVGNLRVGVLINSASGNVIGGTGAGSGNRIAFNGVTGVTVADTFNTGAAGNTIRANAIFDNTGLGINLQGGAENAHLVTANDPGDADGGRNNLQNYPVLTSVIASGNTTTIRGTLHSRPNSNFSIDFFLSTVADPSGFGEGQTHIGTMSNIGTDAFGDLATVNGSPVANKTFTFNVPGNGLGQFITATATNNATRDTSEFSAALQATAPPALSVSINPTAITEGGATALGTVTRNGPTTTALTVNLSTSPTGQITVLTSVIIPIGSATATFAVAAVNDLLFDGSPTVTITASANGFASGAATVTVNDNDLRRLSISLSAPTVTEGGPAVTATVSRNSTLNPAALLVNLGGNPAGQIVLPGTVSIPANATSVTFNVTAVNDTLVDGSPTVTIAVGAASFIGATAPVTVQDNDSPTLTVTTSATSVAEGGVAITGTVTRNTTSNASPLTVNLTSTPAGQLMLPGTVTIPSNAAMATFTITAVNDTFVEAPVTVRINPSASGFAAVPAAVTVTDNDVRTLTVALSAGSVTEGGPSLTGTVSRNTSGSVALTVNLGSSPSGQLALPATVTIPAGSASTTFTITAVDDTLLDDSPLVTVTASAAGFAPGSATVRVNNDDGGRLSLSLSAPTVTEGGASITATVTRNTTVNPSSLVVHLSANPPGQVTLTAPVSIPAGQTSTTFPITAVDDSLVDGSLPVTITASAPNFVSGTDDLTVQDNDVPTLTVTTSASSVSEGGVAITGTVTRNTTANGAPLAVNLTGAPVGQLILPGTVTIPANAASTTFSITAVNDSFVEAPVSVSIAPGAAGFRSVSAPVMVTDDDVRTLTLTLSAATLSEGGGPITGTVSRNTSGTVALTVSLAAGPAGQITVPATVTIPANATTSAPFTISAINDSLHESPQTVTVTASAGGFVAGSSTITVNDDDPQTLSLSLSAPTITEGGPAITATLTRNTAANGTALQVNLSANPAGQVTMPATVTILANATSTTFPLTAVNDTLVDGSPIVTITANATNFGAGVAPVTVADNDQATLTLALSAASVTEGGASITGTVTRSAMANSSPLTVSLTSSPSGQLSVPATVTIAAGATTSAPFSISAINDTIPENPRTVTITASAGGFVAANSTITVNDNDPQSLVLSLSAATVTEGGSSITGTVTRNAPSHSAPLAVSLGSSPAGQLNVPATVTIPGNAASVTFSVAAVNDAAVDGSPVVTVTAAANGFIAGSATITVQDNDVPPAITVDVSPDAVTLAPGGTQQFIAGVSGTANQTVTWSVQEGAAGGSISNSGLYTAPATAGTYHVVATSQADSSKRALATVTVAAPVAALATWGYNEFGQLGDGTTVDHATPRFLPNLSGVTTVAAGGSHSLAILSDRTVIAWGYNGGGQVGDGTRVDRLTPVAVLGLGDVRAVAAGWYHSLALTGDGTVWAWGYNNFGQLGDGTTTSRSRPQRVAVLSDVSAIATGVYFSLALKRDGTIWAWGNNFYGQLGDGTTVDRAFPVQVSGITATGIAAGAGHSVALKRDGTIWAWGWNAYGQLGNASAVDSVNPVAARGLNNMRMVMAGYAHTLAVGASDTVFGWGSNANGQVGNGTTVDQFQPVQASGLTNVRTVAAGAAHSLALRNDGTLWAWGNNQYGALGNGSSGTQNNQPAPRLVANLASVTAIAAGYAHSLALGQAPPQSTASRSVYSAGSARVAASSVVLSFRVDLESSSAADSAHYGVQIDGLKIDIERVAYQAGTQTVTLSLTPNALRSGDQVTVTWSGLRDARGAATYGGTTTLTAR